MAKIKLFDLANIFGLSILVGFTLVITVIAAVTDGNLFYYYEPNKIVVLTEVLFGIIGVSIGLSNIIRLISY